MREINFEEAKKYKGRKVKWDMNNKEGEGKNSGREGDEVYICQDSCDGLLCEDTLGYKYSWVWVGSDVDKCFLLEEYIYNEPLHPYPSWWDGRAIWGRGKGGGDILERLLCRDRCR